MPPLSLFIFNRALPLAHCPPEALKYLIDVKTTVVDVKFLPPAKYYLWLALALLLLFIVPIIGLLLAFLVVPRFAFGRWTLKGTVVFAFWIIGAALVVFGVLVILFGLAAFALSSAMFAGLSALVV